MKMDPRLISSQRHELAHVAYTYDIPLFVVRSAQKEFGPSRERVYQYLTVLGYNLQEPALREIEVCTLRPDLTRALPLGKPNWKPDPLPQPTPTPKGKTGRKPKPQPTPTPVPTPTPTPVPQPSMVACIYFNFDGGTFQHPQWNGGRATIVAAAPLSPEARAQVMLRAQTAFAPYNVAITDDVRVYNAAARRQQVIVTPTSIWYPNTSYSGVTVIGSLFGANECPCFVFTDRLANHPQYVGAIMVHEAGHAVGLRHQSEYGAGCSFIQTYKPGAEMGNALYVPTGEWMYQQCSGQDDKKVLTQNLGLKP